ncbi:MAG: 50S ribosomal protein L4 [Candidatus Aenigmatarchaeota archaeon]|nr:50S ribosomal protein L4 [Candidatus Aenigmarchaeota archaeon]RLJ04834.1 MAG: 50S ribosomal protein L4 [Candidatus Aenigmarchaeota archaeon]
MKTDVFDAEGRKIGKIDLPPIFDTPVKPDVIKRAVLAEHSWSRQPYGSDKMAGKRTSAHYHGSRSARYTMMNREMSRMARIHSSGHLFFRARFVPQAVKGRRAHPPKAEKNWAEKINKKEYELAIKSALAATADLTFVKARGHKIDNIDSMPIVLDINNIKKTKEFFALLKKIGLEEELKRCKKKKIRPGKGKNRGRPYKKKKGPLIIVEEGSEILKCGKNIAGVDICTPTNLTVEKLAPGASLGRLLIITKRALDELKNSFLSGEAS